MSIRLLPLLNIETGAPTSVLNKIIASAPKRYKEYYIAKRTGGKRLIAHPAKELKELQRIVLKEYLEKCQVNKIASAYVKDRGILYNAKIHVGQRWILKLDFKDFFHSITPKDWDRTVRRLDCLSGLAADREIIHRILFWGRGTAIPNCLSIGAPSSPMVSNLICHRLDEWLVEKATDRGLKVSRYADDVTVSGSNVHQLTRFEYDLEKVLEKNKGLKLELNTKKRGLYGPGERKMVTGLVLTPTGEISIGRDRKREIHSLVHKFKEGILDFDETMRAKGLVAFAYSIEPDFVARLSEKYTSESMGALMATVQAPDPQYDEIFLI